MSMASLRAFGPLPVCSQAGGRLAVFPAGRAKRAGKAEGKIKETGTLSGRFLGKPLSAHCFEARRTAPCFWVSRAAIWREALALLGFDRHYSRISPDFSEFWLEARP
ncbi:hypothetical protein QBD01_005062 [Ochrobactrum sp. 19YEA23]|nr:hypothetical protein [Ochrobactrum sp. 19YEA23]